MYSFITNSPFEIPFQPHRDAFHGLKSVVKEEYWVTMPIILYYMYVQDRDIPGTCHMTVRYEPCHLQTYLFVTISTGTHNLIPTYMYPMKVLQEYSDHIHKLFFIVDGLPQHLCQRTNTARDNKQLKSGSN